METLVTRTLFVYHPSLACTPVGARGVSGVAVGVGVLVEVGLGAAGVCVFVGVGVEPTGVCVLVGVFVGVFVGVAVGITCIDVDVAVGVDVDAAA